MHDRIVKNWQTGVRTSIKAMSPHYALGSAAAGRSAIAIAVCAVILGGCGGGGGSDPSPPPPQPPAIIDPLPPPPPPPVRPPTSLSTGPAVCSNGDADGFRCDRISLRSRVPHDQMGGTAGNDIWGWHDTDSDAEYALMGMTNGTAFVNVSDPENPVILGRLPTQTRVSHWRDIKVYRDHAYVVADQSGQHGMQVFDLTRLRGSPEGQTFSADVVYHEFGNAHNLAINEETGFAYVVGSNTCGHGLHIVDLSTPSNPNFQSCYSESAIHDTQCVTYRGPDAEHVDQEICLNSNEDHLAIVDVTDKSAIRTLSTISYPQLGYVHQGWLTEDHRFFLLGDELDESNLLLPTRTHVFDVIDLDAPEYLYAHQLNTRATDHNLYVLGNRVFEANYESGLRVLQFDDLAAREISEVAFFDTYPLSDSMALQGAWSVYPYLPSGTIIVSDITNGLFVLSMQ